MTGKQKSESKTSKKSQERSPGKTLYLFTLLFAGLYIGFAGWARLYYEALAERAEISMVDINCDAPNVGVEYDGITYCTNEVYFAAQQLSLMENSGLYWIFFLPDPLHLLLSGFAFGGVGNLVRIIRIAITKKSLPDYYILSLSPVMGGMTALLLLGATYLFPSVFSGSNIILKPVLQPFLSLIAGAYSEHIQKWLQGVINKFFTIGKEKT